MKFFTYLASVFLLVGCQTRFFQGSMINSVTSGDTGDRGHPVINKGKTLINLSYKEPSGRIKRLNGFTLLEQMTDCFALIEEHFVVKDLDYNKTQYFINTYQIYYPFLSANRMKIHFVNVARKGGVKVISGNATQYVLKMDYDSKANSLIPYTEVVFENDRKDSVKVDLKQSIEIKFSDMKAARDAQGFFWKQIDKCNT